MNIYDIRKFGDTIASFSLDLTLAESSVEFSSDGKFLVVETLKDRKNPGKGIVVNFDELSRFIEATNIFLLGKTIFCAFKATYKPTYYYL